MEPVRTSSRLLVVDDEPAALKLMKHLLIRANYDVITCASSIEGLRLLDETPVDCVITDAIMPSLSGYDLVKAIRQHPVHSAMPVLMITRKRHRQDVKKAVEVGVTDYVLKPIDEDLLLDKVELCLKKGSAKKQMFELTLSEDQAPALLQLECSLVSISESDMVIRSPIPVADGMSAPLKAKVFDDIGIQIPLLKAIHCDRISENPDGASTNYLVKFAFIGVPEADLKKIRTWLHKETIRRRK